MAESPISRLLVRGGDVITMDEQAGVLPATDLLIHKGRIEALGEDLDAPAGGSVLDVSGCWVLPGLIQGHLHLGQTFFRGLAEKRRLLPWLRQRIWPLEAAHDDESAYWCSLLGAAECLLAGTTTIQDIGIGPGIGGLLPFDHTRIVTLPCLGEQALLGKLVLAIEDQDLRFCLVVLQIACDLAGAFVRPRWTAKRVGWCCNQYRTTVRHGLQLLAQ